MTGGYMDDWFILILLIKNGLSNENVHLEG